MSDLVLSLIVSVAIVAALILYAFACHYLHERAKVSRPSRVKDDAPTREELLARYTRAV